MLVSTVLHLCILLLHILVCILIANDRLLIHLGLWSLSILGRHLLIGFQSFDSFNNLDSMKSYFNLEVVL